ncbi:MAG: hypothetical protein JWO20_1133 [Candidatus Angelobacter sp.]|jgi:hypothetical protein|nr:hypothetical protein [Candidatus Angelobacter sp.]
MKLITLLVLSLSGIFALAQKPDVYSLDPLKDTIQERSLGDFSGHAEKYLRRSGDKVSIGLTKIYDEKQLADPKIVKLVLGLVKESFEQPELISAEDDKKPSVTFLLLDSIEGRSKDKNTQNDVEGVKRVITEKLIEYQHRTSTPVIHK